MRLTKRGWAVGILVGMLLGGTADVWNPWAGPYQHEDGSYSDGSCEPGALCDDSADLMRPE